MWKRFVVYMDNSSVLAYMCLTGALAWAVIVTMLLLSIFGWLIHHLRVTIV